MLGRLEGFLLAVLMLAMSFAYTLNVLVRDLAPALASRFAWIDEASLFGLAWTVFLGLGLALERGRHIRMTALLEALPARPRRATKFIIDLAGLAFSFYIAQVCWTVVVLVLNSGQRSPTLDVPMTWLYGPMPVGFTLLGLRYTAELFGATNRHKLEIDPMLRL